MRYLIIFICLFCGNISISSLSASDEVIFSGCVIDAETGLALNATVSVTDGYGHIVNLDGVHEHVFYLDKKRCYVVGDFKLRRWINILEMEFLSGDSHVHHLETNTHKKFKR